MAQMKAKTKDYDKSKANALKARVAKDPKVEAKMVAAKPTAKEAVRKASAQKAGESVAKAKGSTPKVPSKYGEGNEMLRKDKANVSAAQLKASGMSLRSYMNAWKKTGKRPGSK